MLRKSLLPPFVVALSLASCGGDSGPSKAEFIEDADAICREGDQRAEEIAGEAFQDPENPTAGEVLAVLKELIPVQRETIDDVRELEMPDGEEDEINSILDQADAATDEAAEIQDPQEAVAVVQASDTPRDPFYEADKAAQDYGFEDCGE